MNVTTVGIKFRQGLTPLVFLSALAIVGVSIIVAATPSTEISETAPIPFGKALTVTGEVVMIGGNVQIVEDPSGGNKDVHMIMDHLYVAKVAGDEAIQFQINENTRIDEDLKIGDRVEVLAAQNGEALSIRKME